MNHLNTFAEIPYGMKRRLLKETEGMRRKRWLKGILLVAVVWVAANLVTGIVLSDDFPEKLWLHRCNSMEKLYEHAGEFTNVEVDVVFRKEGGFDVTHDVDTSFHLSLEPYFKYMSGTDGRIWLDIKNLEAGNAAVMLAELDSLTGCHRIEKDELIVESPNWEALQLFTKKGYYTSYYMEYDKPQDLSDKEVDACVAELQSIVDRKAVRALSFPGWWYATVKERLNRSIDLLTWKHRTTRLGLLSSHAGRRMLRDPQLKVILVKSKGKYHR